MAVTVTAPVVDQENGGAAADPGGLPPSGAAAAAKPSFTHAFVASFSVMIVSELGDKTFFIAAIMAMTSVESSHQNKRKEKRKEERRPGEEREREKERKKRGISNDQSYFFLSSAPRTDMRD